MAVDTLLNIPLIDFSPFVENDSIGKARVSLAIYRACHEVGFLYLKNHGIPQTAIDAAFEQSRQFFDLPLADKQKLAWSSEFSNRGYVGLERERLDEMQPGDLKEAFNIGKEMPPAVAGDQAALMLNQWPEGQDTFRQTISEFFDLCAVGAARVFRAFAIALSLPESYLVDQHQSHSYTLRLLHYPPLSEPPKPGQIRAGAHSDYGTLTLLFQDEMGGLEIKTATGEWIPAPTIPGTVLINTGDLTERWSNNVFRSTKHRVALPQGEKAMGNRYSIAFFCQPDPDAKIACLPTCHSAENPPQYPPTTSGEYLLRRLQATY